MTFLYITFLLFLFLFTLQYISAQPASIFAQGEDNAHAVDAGMHTHCGYVS